MTAISGVYDNGNFTIFGDNIPKEIRKAKLYIVMIPENEENKNYIPIDSFRITDTSSEDDFKMIGLNKFFREDDDQNVDWEDCFGIKQ